MMIPGGRFREMYYWDAFWIVKGLLASGMAQSAVHVAENIMHLVEQHGLVPNGCRVRSYALATPAPRRTHASGSSGAALHN